MKGLLHKRTKGSHEIWDYPDGSLARPVVFRGKKKQIPRLHIETCLDTLSIDFRQFVKEYESL
ncbi:MAG: hypothetical protein IPH94_09970 [Saprospiraceae bacterium]|nr:hypothetical protein [Saprospiraceae bacterium]MBK7221633.1 hypothetical protein [Saprospiraceae bacterium]MBK8851507.1 hypothetical protein [Saprospiraceae bacterium]MBK9688306.1 hypothetical protein [Saprospiraceae bacterium]